MTVTVAIKALNEEAHIRAALESALRAVAPLGGKVVLGDCGSRDRTVAIAQSLATTAPLRILTLAHPDQRSCGAGAQLAYQGWTRPIST
jgi:glycosyltransferase involved in cell wall biosynthesis